MNNSVANADIRKKEERAGVNFWQIAAKLGMYPCTLTVWLRQEMSAERKAQVKQAIAELRRKTHERINQNKSIEPRAKRSSHNVKERETHRRSAERQPMVPDRRFGGDGV